MKSRTTINDKPLTKRQAGELALKGTLHTDYTNYFTKRYKSGYVELNEVYELPDNQILFIQNKNERNGGKGDLFTRDFFDRFVSHLKRMEDDIRSGRDNNISHWYYYSKHKSNLPQFISALIQELCTILKCDSTALNFTPNSLDFLSERIIQYGVSNAIKDMYDNVVAYVGEVILRNSKSALNWINDPTFEFPVIATNHPSVAYNPINIVWHEFTSIKEVNLKKGYQKEMRHVGSNLKTEQILSKITFK